MEIDSENIEIYMPGDIISSEPGLMRYISDVWRVAKIPTKKMV